MAFVWEKVLAMGTKSNFLSLRHKERIMDIQEDYINQSRIKQILYLLVILLLGYMLARQLSGFVPALLGAITLYMIMRKTMEHLVIKRKWSKGLAATILMLLSFIVILIPIGALIGLLSSKVAYAIEHSNELVEAMKTVLGRVEDRLHVELISQENISKMGGFIAQTIPQLLGATFSTLGTLFFMYFILYFMLVNGKKMEDDIYEYIPLKDENVDKLSNEIENMVLSNAIGIPVIAVLQGIVAVVGYLLIGVNEPWFWFVVTCMTAMLPVVGAAMAYVPLAIIFFASNQTWQGIFMLIYGFGVIGLVDNIFRFTIAKKIGNVHPLVTVFGVIIGLQMFGFIGLIFGPLVISIFILLLKIYSNEFFVKQREMPKTEKTS